MKNEVRTVNEMRVRFPALSINEGMARATIAAFCSQLDPTIDELADIKCAVSEAVTNCIVHAYRESEGDIYIRTSIYSDRTVKIEIKDKGCGIADVEEAIKPLFTTDESGERSGMGFTVIESFTDRMKVKSRLGAGTTVCFYKKLSGKDPMRYGI